ncbi:MAG: hypothetical protein AAF074_11545 [Pseudomonadota bacterium]
MRNRQPAEPTDVIDDREAIFCTCEAALQQFALGWIDILQGHGSSISKGVVDRAFSWR